MECEAKQTLQTFFVKTFNKYTQSGSNAEMHIARCSDEWCLCYELLTKEALYVSDELCLCYELLTKAPFVSVN